MMDTSIFRAYDIRGVVGKSLTAEVVTSIGEAFARLAKQRDCHTVVVARDGRISGPELIEALISGLQRAGCDVIDIGCVPTPVLYFSTIHFKTGTGIMLTGSHNPGDYNGLKMMLDGKTLSGERIQEIKHQIQTGEQSVCTAGTCRHADVLAAYCSATLEGATLSRELHVVVDAGNGVAGPAAVELLTRLGAKVTPLFCDIDGHFPNHHPNPSEPKNLETLQKKVRELGADLGLAFDGDGDRLGVVTETGEIVWPDQLLQLFSRDLLSRQPGATIVFDVKCSRHLEAAILAAGGQPLMSKTGHSFIKETMKTAQASLAGEMSGHFFFADRWYGFDDALIAAIRLLQILSKAPTLSQVWSLFPKSYTTPELLVSIPDDEKFDWMARFIECAQFGDARRNTLDGLRVEWPDGWGLVRVSNTTPALVLRFEADTPEALIRIQNAFKAQMRAVRAAVPLAINF